jgi:urea carboxylase
VSYRSAGTVEFVFDVQTGTFYFLEVNTRLQVEHGVTEMVTGLDLVEWMIRTAANEAPDLQTYVHRPRGHSIQVRVYAEDPGKDFQPSSGLLTEVTFPPDIRCDHWIESGTEITPHYDPLIAKLIVHADTRKEAINCLQSALTTTRIDGIETNVDYLQQVVASNAFQQGELFTALLRGLTYRARTIEILDGGTMTTVQGFPGRIGYWAVGVPPSGPMDSLAFRLGNRLLNNLEGAAGLEMTVTGATLRFNVETTICLTGAEMRARLDGKQSRTGS